jgi:hypothetical protein
MLVYNQSLALIKQFKKDHWLDVSIEDQEYNTTKNTLKILMEDLSRVVNKYSNIKSKSTLDLLQIKYTKAKEYYDIYKYQSIKAGITNGSTIKQSSN